MSTEQCIDRATRMFAVRRAELRDDRLRAACAVNSETNGRGIFHSSIRLQMLEELYRAELRKIAEAAWAVLQSTHRALGSDLSHDMRQAQKTWMGDAIRSLRQELSSELAGEAEKSQIDKRWTDVNLTEAADREFQRYDPLIDNYFDTMKNTPQPGAIVINAQTVGAVVTGGHSVVHIGQDASTTAKLIQSLDQLTKVIEKAPELPDKGKRELLEIVVEAQRELSKPEPNETKLLTFFTVLAQTVQTLPTARPAYDAVKGLLAGFGINLP